MSASAPQPKPEKPSRSHHDVPHIYTLETTGLIVIAVLILVVTLVRYWHSIQWSAR